MNELRIYGHSDDLVEIEGDIRKEINCYDEIVYITVNKDFKIKCEYTNNGTWAFTVELLDETDNDKTLNDYNIECHQAHKYSMGIWITTKRELKITVKNIKIE